MKRNNAPHPIDELRQAYDLFVEVMESPYRAGYIGLIGKLKPESKPLVNLNLFQKKRYIDGDIKELTEKILKIIKFE